MTSPLVLGLLLIVGAFFLMSPSLTSTSVRAQTRFYVKPSTVPAVMTVLAYLIASVHPYLFLYVIDLAYLLSGAFTLVGVFLVIRNRHRKDVRDDFAVGLFGDVAACFSLRGCSFLTVTVIASAIRHQREFHDMKTTPLILNP